MTWQVQHSCVPQVCSLDSPLVPLNALCPVYSLHCVDATETPSDPGSQSFTNTASLPSTDPNSQSSTGTGSQPSTNIQPSTNTQPSTNPGPQQPSNSGLVAGVAVFVVVLVLAAIGIVVAALIIWWR